jgi:glycosyltransferase involved in cell wall biosynthesis
MLLFVGRLAIEKNLDTLFQACAQAFREDRRLRLWVVGDGPYRQECTAMVRNLGIGDRVVFTGFVPRTEVDRYYAAADLFVFSSVTETQGLVVQEAMSYGVPAVTVIGGGASEGMTHGENGYVVKNDPEPFAEAILSLLDDSNENLYTAMSLAARKAVRTYGFNDMTDRVVSVYRQAISQHKPLEVPSLAGIL